MSKISSKERFHAVMSGKPGTQTLLWEMGYWAGTLTRWYNEGLKRGPFSLPPTLPSGASIPAEALPWPSCLPGEESFRGYDVNKQLGFDDGMIRIPINHRFFPLFHETILEEDESSLVMITPQGVKLRASKGCDSIPQFLAWPVHDRDSWDKIKEERLSRDISGRLPADWQHVSTSYGNVDAPVGIFIDGFFGFARELMGVENQLMMYYDQPQLMHDINDHMVNLWINLLEELFSAVKLDFVFFWEDMAFKTGPLMSPAQFSEFIVPYYRRITQVINSHGCNIIFVDTDGDCSRLIPGFLEGGVTGLSPWEVNAGMDIVEIRKQFPQLMMYGGLDKVMLAQGRNMIDKELATKLPFMLQQGRYIPGVDHLVPPNVSWENFCYYRDLVKKYVNKHSS